MRLGPNTWNGAVLAGGVGLVGWALLPAPIAGTVVDAAGRPVAAASVASSSPGAQVSLRTDASGRYQGTGHLWQVEPGMVISAPGFRAQHAGGGRTILHRLPWFEGTVRDDAGNPVSGAVVEISQGERQWRGSSDQEGRFAITARGEGPASVSVTAPDHDGASRRVSLRPDLELTLDPVLPRWLGAVDLGSDPSGVALEVDGAPASACPATPCRIPLTIGHHVVSAPDDFVPWSQAVDLARGQVVQVHPQLTRKTGTLSVNAPAGQLLMDGDQVAAGPWTAQVATGHHTLVFRSAATWPAAAGTDVGWNQTSEVAIQPRPVVPGDTASFQAALQAYLGGIQGSNGVWIQELGSGRTLGVNQDAKLEAASVIKVPEALYLLHQVDAGAVKLTDPVSLQSDDFMSGTGILYGRAKPGDQISYQDLLTDLIRYS
ncbi:MAG: carboxypeptidase regulatory-like domain-containing protein, partial [Candidatus Dormibacteraeota bacterium]|nr:carboxypeptidase regulatory-like domain-containing protein [Candidatus Dormibacteraeota bacterium]